MVNIPASRIDIIDKGLDQEFITWEEDDKIKFLGSLLQNRDSNLKLQFPLPTNRLKPFYQTLMSLYSIIFKLVGDLKIDESIFLAIRLITVNPDQPKINFTKFLVRVITVNLSTTIPLNSCRNCTYLVHLVFFNYPSYFLSTKILTTVKDQIDQEK